MIIATLKEIGFNQIIGGKNSPYVFVKFNSGSWEAFDEIQEETHTGKHYRNHFVKVPTAPGEPCRG